MEFREELEVVKEINLFKDFIWVKFGNIELLRVIVSIFYIMNWKLVGMLKISVD